MTDKPNSQATGIIVVDGIRHLSAGPFDTVEEAKRWGTAWCRPGTWAISPLHNPEALSDVIAAGQMKKLENE